MHTLIAENSTNIFEHEKLQLPCIINGCNEDNLRKLVIISDDNSGGAINPYHSVYHLSVANSAIAKKLHFICTIASLSEMV
jgi:hypothetical protein